jgi:hypothetical protein
MAVAVAEVSSRMAIRQPQANESRRCRFCEAAGQRSDMLHHRPLRDHWYCTSCGNHEIDWEPICARVKAVFLWEYSRAKARLNTLPAAPAMRYDDPYVEGGLAVSQQEAHIQQEAHDHWVVSVVENTFRYCLTSGQKNVIAALYFERHSYRATAEKLQIAKSTVEAWEEEALKAFARTARWA